MKTYKEVINEAAAPSKESVKAALDSAKVHYKGIKASGKEIEILSGKTGNKKDEFEEAVYDALLKAKINLAGISVI